MIDVDDNLRNCLCDDFCSAATWLCRFASNATPASPWYRKARLYASFCSAMCANLGMRLSLTKDRAVPEMRPENPDFGRSFTLSDVSQICRQLQKRDGFGSIDREDPGLHGKASIEGQFTEVTQSPASGPSLNDVLVCSDETILAYLQVVESTGQVWNRDHDDMRAAAFAARALVALRRPRQFNVAVTILRVLAARNVELFLVRDGLLMVRRYQRIDGAFCVLPRDAKTVALIDAKRSLPDTVLAAWLLHDALAPVSFVEAARSRLAQ